MATIKCEATIEVTANFTVSESELRALHALCEYSDDAFLKTFYENLGRAYMAKHEEGMRTFLKSMRSQVPGILHRIVAARQAFNNN